MGSQTLAMRSAVLVIYTSTDGIYGAINGISCFTSELYSCSDDHYISTSLGCTAFMFFLVGSRDVIYSLIITSTALVIWSPTLHQL